MNSAQREALMWAIVSIGLIVLIAVHWLHR